MLDASGDVKITGLRQMISLAQFGVVRSSVFSLVGDNIEWCAPEVIAQVRETKEGGFFFNLT